MPATEGVSAGDAAAPAQRAAARLSEAALASIRAAFADEVRERLPRLRAAVGSADDELLRAALRDVHTLGSSAYVVGEPEAALAARAAEAELAEAGASARFTELVAELDARLAGWRA